MYNKIISTTLIILTILGSFSAIGINLKNDISDDCECGSSPYIFEKRGLGELPTNDTSPSGESFSGDPPSSFDWRNYNGNDWTTPIKNQGGCNSCYAFSSIAAVESIYKIENNEPNSDIDLSEQFIVSCGKQCYYNDGCAGGRTIRCLEFIRDNGVITEEDFPYQTSDKLCHSKSSGWSNSLIKISYCGNVGGTTNPSVKEIKNALIQCGPLPSKMRVYEDFHNSGDVPYYPNENHWPDNVYYHRYGGSKGYHSILIVGYNDNPGYWICKNSWGTDWGINGWFKIEYGDCEINYDTYYVNGVNFPSSVSEIYAYDDINWNNVEPGSALTGSFTIENIGTKTIDEWWVIEYSGWGRDTWSLTPDYGTNLGPGEQVEISVSVEAPSEYNQTKHGLIKIETNECYNCDIIRTDCKTIKTRCFEFSRIINLFNKFQLLQKFLLNF